MYLRKLVSIAASAALLVSGTALAESVSFDGTVSASNSVQVYATLGGTVDSVPVSVGETVSAGTALATLRTTKVYAQEDGEVSAVFGQAGDDAAVIAERYGAVIYTAGNVRYTISATTNAAYSSIETTYITPGETVYLGARSSNERTGKGVITTVSGNTFTVEVTEGAFIVGEAVNIYSDDTMKNTVMLGKGSAARAAAIAVTAEGTIVNIPVTAGQTVKRGDLLLETLSGTAEALKPAGNTIVSGVDGTVASLSVTEGTAITQDQLAAVIYPNGSMVVEGYIFESDLNTVHVGDAAIVTLAWNEDSGVTYAGMITDISCVASENTADTENTEASYKVTVSFQPDDNTRYGMTATVLVGSDVPETAAEAE